MQKKKKKKKNRRNDAGLVSNVRGLAQPGTKIVYEHVNAHVIARDFHRGPLVRRRSKVQAARCELALFAGEVLFKTQKYAPILPCRVCSTLFVKGMYS